MGNAMNRVSFETTQWTVILAAAESQAPGAEAALSVLCQRYWPPLYFYVRRRGYNHEDAQDLTQEFFARLLDNSDLKQVDRARGRFRSFLLASICHFLTNEWHRSQTQKHGGGWAAVPVTTSEEAERVIELCHHETPEKTFERKWAQALLERERRAVISGLAAGEVSWLARRPRKKSRNPSLDRPARIRIMRGLRFDRRTGEPDLAL